MSSVNVDGPVVIVTNVPLHVFRLPGLVHGSRMMVSHAIVSKTVSNNPFAALSA